MLDEPLHRVPGKMKRREVELDLQVSPEEIKSREVELDPQPRRDHEQGGGAGPSAQKRS